MTSTSCAHLKVVHVYVGYLVLLATLIQSVVGALKYAILKPGRAKCHNTIGLIVWIVGFLDIFLAGCFWSSPSYGPVIMGLSTFCVVGTLMTALYVRIKSRNYPLTAGFTSNLESYDRVPNITPGDYDDDTFESADV